MTREEILALDMADLEKRSLEIAEEVKTAESDALDTLSEELDAIEERKAIIKAEAEEKRAAMEEVLSGKGEVIEEKQEEKRTMDSKEIRSTVEYETAWVDYIKGNKSDEEVRALLSENVSGKIPVPTYVEERIQTSWNSDEFMSRVRKVFYKGNLKVATEADATNAMVHTEGASGDGAVSEETLNIVVQILQPKTLKKWITISDEVWDDFTGREFEDYILDEIEHKIIEAAGSLSVNAINDAATAGVYTGALPVTALGLTDIVEAVGQLSGDARNIAFVANRATISAYQALAINANYAVDPFAGAEVIAVDWLPTFENVRPSTDLVIYPFAYVGDLSSFTYNFPNGDQPTFKIDELSMAELDMVKIVGRMPVAVGMTKMNGITVIGKKNA